MDKQKIIDTVLLNFPSCDNERDLKYACDKAVELYQKCHWSLTDIIEYLSCTEEFNPELDEQVALFKMQKIKDKYPKFL